MMYGVLCDPLRLCACVLPLEVKSGQQGKQCVVLGEVDVQLGAQLGGQLSPEYQLAVEHGVPAEDRAKPAAIIDVMARRSA